MAVAVTRGTDGTVSQSQHHTVVTTWAVPNIGEINPGDNLSEIIWAAISALASTSPDMNLRDGDIIVITSKIVSKSENRFIPATEAANYLRKETVRIVASRQHADGETIIVENSLGIVAASAGIDHSNVPQGFALLLPQDPDRSAREITHALRSRSGLSLGVIISDTLGRAWRIGQTDCAIGAAGIRVITDLRGKPDDRGVLMSSTITATGDEIAAMADLVKGKSGRTPVAVVRGLAHLVTKEVETDGGNSLVRPSDEDMFQLGTQEAFAQGFAEGVTEGRSAKSSTEGVT